MAWLAPADRQIDQAVLMPQLVGPVAGDGVEVLLSALAVARRQSAAARAVLGPKGVLPLMSIAASAAIDARGIAKRILRAEQISEERKLSGFKCQLATAPARSRASMDFTKAMNDQVAKQVR
eukprot:549580-Pyramimonas_sp.AAC.1